MRPLFFASWNDERADLIASAFLFVATNLAIGIVVGFASVRDAVTTEFSGLAIANMALSLCYGISGQTGCSAIVDGSQAHDSPTLVPVLTCAPAAIPGVMDDSLCN